MLKQHKKEKARGLKLEKSLPKDDGGAKRV